MSTNQISVDDNALITFIKALSTTLPEDEYVSDSFEAQKTDKKTDADDLTYFFPFYSRLYSRFETVPLRIDKESQSALPFRTYDHPIWSNWTEIWDKPPLVLDPNQISNTTDEYAFRSALFRLSITSKCIIRDPLTNLSIHQGTTIVFKDYEDFGARHIIEWCQWIEDHTAYLKVVGVNSSGDPFPYNDPDFPTFFLEVPACIANVPIPSSILPTIPFDYEFSDEEEKDRKVCWACY
jgi:hypothetical protein